MYYEPETSSEYSLLADVAGITPTSGCWSYEEAYGNGASSSGGDAGCGGGPSFHFEGISDDQIDKLTDSIDYVASGIHRIAGAMESRTELEYIKHIESKYVSSKEEFPLAYKEIFNSHQESVVNSYFGNSIPKNKDALMIAIEKEIRKVYKSFTFDSAQIYNIVDVWDKQGKVNFKKRDMMRDIAIFPYCTASGLNLFAVRSSRSDQWMKAFNKTMTHYGKMDYVCFVVTGDLGSHVILDLHYLSPKHQYYGGRKIVQSDRTLSSLVVPKSQVLTMHNMLLDLNTGTGNSELAMQFFPLENGEYIP